MLVQYLAMKREHPDSILFYRMGDFYEMFFEDAIAAAPILEVQLTSRDKNAEDPIPMCGVPHHSALGYIQKLLAHGFKVALCEQVEDPTKAQGLVKREVIRVLTPALVGDPDLVREDQKALLLAVKPTDRGFELCLLDLFASEIRLGRALSLESLAEVVREFQPKEVLLPSEVPSSVETLFSACLVTKRDTFGSAEEALKRYGEESLKARLPSLSVGPALFGSDALVLDSVTLSSLEVTKANSEGGVSLSDALNLTGTSMGKRLLKDWLSRPSRRAEVIEDRLDAVQSFLDRRDTADLVRSSLSNLRDLERLATKTALGLAMPRDLVSIRDALLRLPALKACLLHSESRSISQRGARLKPLEALANYLQRALEDLPPAVFREGGIFRPEFDPRIAECRALVHDAKSTLAAMEDRERARTGIASLKIKFSRVFGYTIEVTTSHLSKVPKEYIRKQTISTGERFITEELKNFEEKALTAEHRGKALEESLFLEIRNQVAAEAPALLENARVLAEIDVLQSFARTAQTLGYTRPTFQAGGLLDIEDGRHPVVETLLKAGTFVPNSVRLCPESARTLILTGPNMGGKSTIMRQVALICLLAQAGSFVPASRATLPLLDAIFTRIGSSDDLARGQSTFMVEMTEVARILKTATVDSLVIIDEIGRGTSTYDGLSLAWSLLEYLHLHVRAKTLFATHFHEMSALENTLPGVKNASVLVEKWKDSIVFLYKLGAGVCGRSYGIEVAKLAGLPSEVLVRARQIQGHLESESQRSSRTRSTSLAPMSGQLAFFEESGPPDKPSPLDA